MYMEFMERRLDYFDRVVNEQMLKYTHH